jgi:hypothetical protein
MFTLEMRSPCASSLVRPVIIAHMRVQRLLLGLVCGCGSVNGSSSIDAGALDASGLDASTCAPTPASLAARWSGENNTNDDKGRFNATSHGQLGYTQGRFGSAFLLDGTTAYITADNGDVLWPTGCSRSPRG